jgi:hypothetical protein
MAGLSGVWHTFLFWNPFVFSQVRASMKWEMWTSTMCLLHINHKRGVFRMLVRTKMVPGKHPSSGTCFNTADSIYLTHNIIILQQIQYNFWLITAFRTYSLKSFPAECRHYLLYQEMSLNAFNIDRNAKIFFNLLHLFFSYNLYRWCLICRFEEKRLSDSAKPGPGLEKRLSDSVSEKPGPISTLLSYL